MKSSNRKIRERRIKRLSRTSKIVSKGFSYNVNMKVPEKEEEKIKKYLGKKKIAKSFPYLMKDINLQIQEFQQTPSRMSTKKTS